MSQFSQFLSSKAAEMRAGLDRPSPDVYRKPTARMIAGWLTGWTDDEVRHAVSTVQRWPRVHPAARREQLIETIATHFQHAVNHQKRVATGERY